MLASCQRTTDVQGGTASDEGDVAFSIDYAQNFTLEQVEQGVYHLHIANAESKHSAAYDYLLVKQDATPSDSLVQAAKGKGYTTLQLPLTRVICMTSLQLSNFIAIQATDHVAGITSTRHLFDSIMNRQLADGTTMQIGIEGNFDTEMVMAVSPDVILISPSKRGGFDGLAESGIPLIPHLGYQELTPLGQAEWVKLVGLLTGHLTEANQYFQQVAGEYHRLCELVKSQQSSAEGQRPTIMSGDMKGGAWYATGGQSFLAQVFRDAGARYFMDDDTNSGGVNLDFEVVYAQGADADYWRVSNSFHGEFSYEDLALQDARFRDFKSYRNRQVVYCNMSKTPFYESFPVHPDLLLSDFVHIFHPELLPEYVPTYYHLLK